MALNGLHCADVSLRNYSLTPLFDFIYAPQLYRQVLLRHVLPMGILSVILSVCLSVCHDPVVYQAQVR